MRIVIDIPQDACNSIYHGGLYLIGHDRLDQCITEAFQTARIIPIDCGDLIDRDSLINHFNTNWCGDAVTEIQKAPAVVPKYRGDEK